MSLALAIGLGVSACSPNLFWDDDIDEGVRKMPHYRQVSIECRGLNLSKPALDVPTVRQLVRCFNSNQSMPRIAALMETIADRDLQPMVDLVNEYILTDSALLYEIEHTYFSLDRRGLVDVTFQQLGRLLENEEFVVSSISLMKKAIQGPGPGAGGVAVVDPDLLRSIEKLSTKLDVKTFGETLDDILAIVSARAFGSVQTHFKNTGGSGLDLREDIIRPFVQYLRIRDPGHLEMGKEMLRLAVSGELFSALDRIFGRTAVTLQTSVPAQAAVVSSLMKRAGAHGNVALDDLTSLFSAMNRPIPCMKGAKEVPNGIRWAIDRLLEQQPGDLSEFIRRDNPVILAAMGPFCDYPIALDAYYPVMTDLASRSTIRPMVETLRDFDRSPRLMNVLIRFLSDTHGGNGGVKWLIPALTEIDIVGGEAVWADALLLANLTRVENRASLQESIRFFIESDAKLGGRSLYDVMMEIVSRTDVVDFYRLVRSLRRFVDDEKPILEPALRAIREAYHVNTVHPGIQLVQKIMSDASRHHDLFRSMIRVTEYPELAPAIAETAMLARNGGLRDLIGGTITLFHRFALQGKKPIEEGVAATLDLESKRRHNLTSGDLRPYGTWIESAEVASACGQLSLLFKLDAESAPGYDTQLQNFLDCFNSDGEGEDVIESVRYLREAKTSDGRSYFTWNMDLMARIGRWMNAFEIREVVDGWLRTIDDGTFFSVLEGVRILSRESVWNSFLGMGDEDTALRPLLNAAGPLLKREDALNRLQDFGGAVLLRPDLARIVEYGEKIWDARPDDDFGRGKVDLRPYIPQIRKRVQRYECEASPTPRRPNDSWELKRSLEIIDDYENTITSWEWRRKGWRKAELKACLGGGKGGPSWCKDSLFHKLAEPRESSGFKSVTRAMTNFLRYFGLPDTAVAPGQREFRYRESRQGKLFKESDLVRWLHERSNDFRFISYYYPGQKIPRARFVNTLDLLELVLINADLDLSEMPGIVRDIVGVEKNNALYFLALIGEAWGDEPRHLWPKQIQRKYPPGKKPPTLREAYEEMKSLIHKLSFLVGFPDVEPCPGNENDPYLEKGGFIPDWMLKATSGSLDLLTMKSSLYNIFHVMKVIEENLPGSKHRHAGGMRILRNLFYEMYTSTPPEYRDPGAKWKNNLSVVVRLVRMGLTRQISRALSRFELHDPAIQGLGLTLVRASQFPETVKLLDAIFRDDYLSAPRRPFSERLIWKVADRLFDRVDQPEASKMNQLLVHLMAQLSQRDLGDRERLLRPMVANMRELVLAHRDFLSRNVDQLTDVLESERIYELVKGLYRDEDWSAKKRLFSVIEHAIEKPGDHPYRLLDLVSLARAVEEDPRGKGAIRTFFDRIDLLRERGVISRSLEDDWGGIARKIVAALKEDPSKDCGDLLFNPAWHEARKNRQFTACKFRGFLFESISKRDLNEILRLISGFGGPGRFHELMSTLGRYIEKGDLQEFFRLARKSLPLSQDTATH